jgi:hypothetical protein
MVEGVGGRRGKDVSIPCRTAGWLVLIHADRLLRLTRCVVRPDLDGQPPCRGVQADDAFLLNSGGNCGWRRSPLT